MPTERLRSAKPLLRLDPRTGTIRELHYRVQVAAGPDAGREVELRETVVIGTRESCGLRLTDKAVSGQHVQLDPSADGVLVRDLRSTNGTHLGAARIETALVVEREAALRIGKTTLRISVSEDAEVPGELPSFGPMVAGSSVMRRLFGVLARVAASDSTVLLQGETGTGKEVLAQAIHAASPRRGQRFVIVDCGAIPVTLIDSELFGHARGAFTGAERSRAGAFLESDGGTLFLDEVGELPLEVQPRLLRAIEARTIKRLGEDRPRRVDVRVIAATHRDLDAEVRAGRFREDLLFRLAVVTANIPPLRERLEDLEPLVRHFLAELHRPDFALPPQMLADMRAYAWPGNVRELRNLVSRTVTLGGASLAPEGAPPGASRAAGRTVPEPPAAATAEEPLPFKEAKERLLDAFTRAYLEDLAQRCGSNISKMARLAGIARAHVRTLLDRYGMKGDG